MMKENDEHGCNSRDKIVKSKWPCYSKYFGRCWVVQVYLVVSISHLVLIAIVISIAENSVIAREDAASLKVLLMKFTLILKIVNESVTLIFRDRDVKCLFNGDWV